jgi:hypothetical protein
MGIAYNPRIVTDGLVLALDAGNNKSHSTNRFISYGSGLVTENVAFSVNGTGTFQRVAAGTVIGGYTVKTTDVVYSYALGATGCHYHGNDVPIPSGVYATFTFDYLVTGATTYPIVNYLANFENRFSNSIGTANSEQDIWQRRSFTSGPSPGAGSLRMLLYPGACGTGRLADSGTLYFRNPRVEFSSVDTGTENFSSMSNLTTWYDMVGSNNGTLTNTPYHFIGNNSDGTNGYMSFDGVDDYIVVPDNSILDLASDKTLSCWVYMGANSSGCGIAGKMSSSVYGMALAYGWNDNGFQAIAWNSTNNPNLSKDLSRDINKWVHITAVQSGSTRWIYAWDGAGVRSSSYSGGTHSWDNNVGFYVGCQASLSSFVPANTRIAQVSIYNRALTADEVQQNFNAQRNRFGI